MVGDGEGGWGEGVRTRHSTVCRGNTQYFFWVYHIHIR